jgi:hypothetical protein
MRAGGFRRKTNTFSLTKFEPRIVHHAAKSPYQLRNPESKSKCGLDKATCREALLSAVRFEYYHVNQSKQDETGQARSTHGHV